MVDNNYASDILLLLILFLIMKAKKVRVCKGYLYSNVSYQMLSVSYIYRYFPLQISNLSGDIRLFKLIGTLSPNSVELR